MKTLRYLGSWVVDVVLTYVIFLALWIPLALFFSKSDNDDRRLAAILLTFCTFGVLPWLRVMRHRRSKERARARRRTRDSAGDDFGA